MSTDLKKLAELARKATPGPWSTWKTTGAVWGPDENESQVCEVLRTADYEYIAAANPQVILELIEEVERLRKQVNELECELDECESEGGELLDAVSAVREGLRANQVVLDGFGLFGPAQSLNKSIDALDAILRNPEPVESTPGAGTSKEGK